MRVLRRTAAGTGTGTADAIVTNPPAEPTSGGDLNLRSHGAATGLVAVGKDVIRHVSRLSRAAVAGVKAAHGLGRCVTGNDENNRLIARHKDPRSLFIDVMKVIKLDEGGSAFLPAVTARIGDDVREVFAAGGYELPTELLHDLASGLAAREVQKYSDRMYEVRKYVALRLNEVLRRQWVAGHGDVVIPDSYFINPRKSEDDELHGED